MRFDKQKDFAKFLGVTEQQISLWENQEKQPKLETAWRLKEKIGCKLDDLFEWIEESGSPFE